MHGSDNQASFNDYRLEVGSIRKSVKEYSKNNFPIIDIVRFGGFCL
jgi:hypothetical protein